MTAVAFLAEASPIIGTGHVVETGTLVREARGRGLDTAVWINADAPSGLRAHLPPDVRIVPGFEIEEIDRIGAEARALGARTVVTNLRHVSNDQVTALARRSLRVVCIDEWGNRALDCDAVVNPTPVPRYHRYTSECPGFRLYAGVSYLALSADYQCLHGRPRPHRGPVASVAIAMGGVDRTGIALRLIDMLMSERPALELRVAVGAGFPRRNDLDRLCAAGRPGAVRIHQDLPSLAEVLAGCDVGFTVGGNTLLEMACVGTPALVLYEEPHERDQSEALEVLGFGRCLGPGASPDRAAITKALTALDDPAERARQSTAGRALVDGRGARRILDVVAGL